MKVSGFHGCLMSTERPLGKAGKKILKESRKFSDEDILTFLISAAGSLSLYYLQDSHEHTSVRSWNQQNGSMMMSFDDEAMFLAVVHYLERKGIPHIATKDDLEALAHRNNWLNFHSA